ncbi:hypothetical protein EV424DRAFT_1047765 [Suillus variegatus]|nr:hypothetical protein EV424DRAFT_1047765 [Suillus variegatus]
MEATRLLRFECLQAHLTHVSRQKLRVNFGGPFPVIYRLVLIQFSVRGLLGNGQITFMFFFPFLMSFIFSVPRISIRRSELKQWSTSIKPNYIVFPTLIDQSFATMRLGRTTLFAVPHLHMAQSAKSVFIFFFWPCTALRDFPPRCALIITTMQRSRPSGTT